MIDGYLRLASWLDRHGVASTAIHSDRAQSDRTKALEAFKAGEITTDTVVVVRFQGPSANGMPELHSLTPSLTILQDRGLKMALVTDGRMSGASGKVPAAIHLVPEAAEGGILARVQDGDIIRVNAVTGELMFMGDMAELEARQPVPQSDAGQRGCGRELFAVNRNNISDAEQGASYLFGGD